MNNKKGLSTVVTTLIIILLVLVAVGIIWGVVNNLLTSTSSKSDVALRCLDVDVQATKVITVNEVNGSSNSYNVTLKRTATGDAIGGVKLVFFNAGGNTGILDFGSSLAPLETKTATIDAGISGANKIEVTSFFTDDSGNENLCEGTKEFAF
ncbi:hypothetical protein HOD29_06720 [archaeon]|nr:hypothetical protein [archaeon]